MNIYTINSRDFIVWNILINHIKLSSFELNKELVRSFQHLEKELASKKLNYEEFKNILIPQKKRKEIALVFDTTKSDCCWYSCEILYKLLPSLFDSGKHAVLTGDLCAPKEFQDKIHETFVNKLVSFNETTYQDSMQYYLVYINYLTKNQIVSLTDSIKDYSPFVGYFDFTYSCPLKSYIASIISQDFLIIGKKIIVSKDTDEDDEKDSCEVYDFEQFGFSVSYIAYSYYHSFLSYKIEREIFENEIDTQVAIISISDQYSDMYDFQVLIEEKKLKYLNSEKADSVKRLGDICQTPESLSKVIKKHLKTNYIFNMTLNKQHQICKFNIMLELPISESKNEKFLLSLEYRHESKDLRLLTMY